MSTSINKTNLQASEETTMGIDKNKSFSYKSLRVANFPENGVISGEFDEVAEVPKANEIKLSESIAQTKRDLAKTAKEVESIMDADELKKLLANPK